ncbi:heat shock factor binding protein [Staphylococcus phage PALS_2]|nr:heat shock factor binding protein [Staphylococcus phage PALS_2]
MGRFHYSPIDYKDYMNKYFNSLQTGELLIDFEGADIYVSEEGYNIPIPSNKKLKDDIIKYLENSIEGINYRTREIPRFIKQIEELRRKIEEQQDLMNRQYDDINMGIDDNIKDLTYISKVTENNVQQLGDLKLSIDKNDLKFIDKRLLELVNEFNLINSDSRNKIYVQDAQNKSKQLTAIWNEINALMDDANKKLSKMGSFSGTMMIKRSVTTRRMAYDAYYSKRLFNFTTNGGHGDIGFPWSYNYASNLSTYLDFTKRAKRGFIKWFYGQKYLDSLTRLRFPAYNGSGFWYKGFATKKDVRNGSIHGKRNPSWDLFETVPLKGQLNQTDRNNFNLPYIRSATNYTMFDAGNWSGEKKPNTYNHTSVIVDSRAPTYRIGGSQTFQRNFKHIGKKYDVDTKLINRIVAKDDGTQRTPRYKFNNKDMNSCVSAGAPTFPVIVRDIPFISHTGFQNREGMVIRMGVSKYVSQTEIRLVRMKFNNSKGWVKA